MREDDRPRTHAGGAAPVPEAPAAAHCAKHAASRELVIHATRPGGTVAKRLLANGIDIRPGVDDDDQADRYLPGPGIAVDRRTPNGFVNGILDKSLFTAALYLRDRFDVAILIIEGARQPAHRGFAPEAVDGALTALMLEYGVSVLHTDDVDETVRLLTMMARQAQHGIAEISLVPKRSAASLPDMQRRVVEMLPGCGRVMARELLRRFRSIDGIVAAPAGELRTIRGIGAKRAEQIRHVLTADYESLDTEQQIEDALAAHPELLLAEPAELVARQHRIQGAGAEFHVVDLVFRLRFAPDLILVELKRGTLESAHVRQLRRYLDNAAASPLLRRYLEAGYRLSGMLASPDGGRIRDDDPDIGIVQLDAKALLEAIREPRK